ncbi:MAG: hypothetical protein JOZ85_12785 [Betaproteobacteria bacterium]|nr:hypothetical protein [Betaproteobacteria bacterium]
MSKPKLLVAGTPIAIKTLKHLVGEEVDYLPARSMDAALHGLEEHPDMIVCNVRFDESRMLNLLQAAKESPETRETPFLCVRLAPMPPSWKKGIEIAALALGAVAFVDLSSLEKDVGREAAEQQLRRLVLTHLPQER